MLLLVVGLVVIVLVILVVVFLSVRSMRADEGDDHPVRPPYRKPEYAGADDSQPRAMARRGRGDPRGYPGYDRDEDGGDRDPAPPRRAPVPRAAASQPRRSPLPRPRGHQHDQELEAGAGPDDRDDSPRRQRQESRQRPAGTGRDRSGADWPASDWDGVSDEQYWAELSADKPLATTARSAQPGSDPRPPARSAGTGAAVADVTGADVTGRRAGRDAASGRSRREPAPTMAAAGAPTAQFSFRSPPELPAGGSPMPADPWTDPVSIPRGSDTDPSIGGTAAGWRDTAGDDPVTTAWTATDPEAPAAGDISTAAGDTRTWAAEDPLTSPSFSAEDPLTSPSFSAASAYSADSRSYRGSHDRALTRRDELAGIPDGAPYAGGDAYVPARGWDDTPGPEAAAPSAADSYGSRTDRWPGSDHAHPSGPLEPLPGLPGSAEPAGSWSSAPIPESRTDPGQRGWQAAEPDYLAGSGYGQSPGYGTGHDQGFPASGYGDGQQPGHGYDGDTGYGQSAQDWSDSGYQLPEHGAGDNGYQLPDHGAGDNGYQLPDHDTGAPDYGRPGYDQGDSGYQLPDHGSSGNGYQQSRRDQDSAGYEQPGYDPDEAGYQLPGYGSAGSGYQPPDHGTGAPDYGRPGYDPGGSGYFGQGPGYGRYPGYDGERR